MANARELVKKKKRVQNTQKITRTMELVSTAKLKKLGNKLVNSRPYANELVSLVKELLLSGVELDLAQPHSEVKNVLVLTMASNRGLCGAYNAKVVEEAKHFIQEQTSKGRHITSNIIGKRAISMFNFRGLQVDHGRRDIDDRTTFAEYRKMAQEFLDMFAEGEVDEVHVIYSKFHSAGNQSITVEQLLPIVPETGQAKASSSAGEFTFEPSPEAVLSEMAPLSVQFNLFRMHLEASASEQAFRMRAMKNATDNAEQLIKDLKRQYNRARQTQITMEMLDILGGVEAL